MAKKGRVLDSWGVVAFLEDQQPASMKMEEILAEAHEAGTPLYMTTVNLGEVWYSLARAHDARLADEKVSEVRSLGIEIVPADWELARQAAAFKAKGNIDRER